MILVDLVKPYRDLKPDEILAILSEQNISVVENKNFSYKDMIVTYGEGFVKTLLDKIKSEGAKNPILDATYIAILTNGLNFSAQENKDIIQNLLDTNIISQDELDKLISLNEKVVSLLEQNGLEADTKDITQALDDIQKEEDANIYKIEVLTWWVNLHNQIIPQIMSGTITKEQIKELVNS